MVMHVRRKLAWAAAAVVVVAAIAAVAAGPIMSNVEQPDYRVSSASGAVEIREYPPLIAAEAEVAGERQAAIGEGFRLIAAYIFGANTPNAKIAMTAPVEQQRRPDAAAGREIAMTAPVTQQGGDGRWSVRFIMPKSWTMETLPAPADPRVRLVAVPAKRMAVIRFSGTAGPDLLATKTAELDSYLKANGLVAAGEPTYAFYNPPWTLPPLRRNEIMVELPQG